MWNVVLLRTVRFLRWSGFVTKHDDVIKWKHFPRYWPFVRGNHRSPVNSPHKGQWRGALIFSLIWVWINGWVNNREAGDQRCYRAHYCVIVMGKICVAGSKWLCSRFVRLFLGWNGFLTIRRFHRVHWQFLDFLECIRQGGVCAKHGIMMSHQMETFSSLLVLCTGNSPVTSQRPVTRSFDVFFDLRLE